jgi:hypothetical protein
LKAPTLAIYLVLSQRINLGAQTVDDDPALRRHDDWIDVAASRPRGVFLASFPFMVVKEAVASGVAQPRYPVDANVGEIILPIAAPLYLCNVRSTELHLRILAALLAMGTEHQDTEVRRTVKPWGRRLNDLIEDSLA